MRRLVVIALVLATAPAPARADRAKAEAYFDAGGRAYRGQSFAAAAEQFELAYAELALPEIAFSAAQAYRRQYYVDPRPEYVKRAVELYKVYLASVKSGGRVADASDGLAEMQRELDRLVAGGTHIAEVRRDLTRIAVSVSVTGEARAEMKSTELAVLPAGESTGAQATLDGKPMELFAPVEVTPGDHTVEVTAAGYQPVSETRRVVEGSTELVSVALVPKPAHLTVITDDGATIALNGRVAGSAPLATQELPTGDYLVTVTRRGREPAERQLALARDQTATLALPLVPTAKRRAVPWLFGAAGVLALGSAAAAVVAVHYDHTMSSIDGERTTTGITTAQLTSYRAATRDRDDTRIAAFGLGGAAVAAAALGAALYYFDVPAPDGRVEHVVAPMAAPHAAGVSFVGRF